MAKKSDNTPPKEEKAMEEEINNEEVSNEEVDVSIEEEKEVDLEKELEKQKDLVMRTAAEFTNYKKRVEREKAASIEFIKADIVKSFLPVLDNFGLALKADTKSDDFSKGIEMIQKQLLDVMVKLGLSEINDEGKEFNPDFHQAVSHIDDDNYGENIISATLQVGYKIGDTVVRPAMVQVAN